MRSTLPALVAAAALACSSPPPPGPDELLYQRAHDAGLRRSAEAEELYRKLVREHPSSPRSPDAHLALAELLYKAESYEAALAQYEQVLRHPRSRSWGYALYKQGWCHLKRDRPEEALQIFERVITTGPAADPPGARHALADEARRDLVKAYARTRGPGPAAEYFHKWGGTRATELLDLLAEHYFEGERRAEADQVWRDLIATHPDSPRLCAWQNGIVRAAMLTGDRKAQVEEVQRLGAVLNRLEHLADVPPAELQRCRLQLRDTLKELALSAHKKGQKESSPALYELADPLYRQYLTRFREEKDAYAMTFFHADLLWSLERWAESAAEYRRVLELDPQGKLTKEAAYGHVLATKNALELDDATTASGTGPRGFSPAERQLIAAIDVYAKHVPEGPEAVKMKYRKARMHFEHGRYDEALPLFRELVERHCDDELCAFAVNLELDCLATLGRHAEVCTRVEALRARPRIAGDGELAATLRALGEMCQGQAAAKPAESAVP